MQPQPADEEEGAPDRFALYRPLPGVADELRDASGAMRPAWKRFAGYFNALPPEDLTRRFARGDRYLRDAGVYYRKYGENDATERAWPLSHVPVLVDEAEWQVISRGLVERADLLEEVVADLYGPAHLVTDGHLPAALVAQSPEWLRPLVGVKPAGGRFLNFVAFEIGRGPDGNWWVLGDRTQAPSGAGFALENRMAAARVFSDFYPEANVRRLAGFFRAFRDTLFSMRAETGSRVGILTPGQFNDTYFEHAYIARYLGLMLLEGEDLAVEDGRVMVRTVAGLAPISVLWRRLDAAFADPMELDERSRLGTPGMVDAVRQGNVAIVNALGTGILETRALMAFLPRIAEVLTGRSLSMPNIATWWCGSRLEREFVRANAGRMMIGPALSTRLPFDADALTRPGGSPRGGPRAGLDEELERDGALLVGQEAVTLSTTPAYVAGRLVPRPMTIRVFLARTADGWQVMPGGYARIGAGEDAAAISMQSGGAVADVWVVSRQRVAADTMLPSAADAVARRQQGVLPARAADNLFWLGRYVERAEGMMRLLRAYHGRLDEDGADAPLPRAIAAYLDNCGADVDEGIPQRLLQLLGSAISNAGRVRDRFSVDGWMALNDLAKSARRLAATVEPGDDAARAMGVFLRKITGFSGLVHENMYRSTGWRFLTIGRSIERVIATADLLAALVRKDAPDGALDLAVEVGDSVMTHRRRFLVGASRATVIDLLALDEANPRAILHHLAEIRDQQARIAATVGETGPTPLSRLLLEVHAGLAVATPDGVDIALLERTAARAAEISDLLSAAYLA